LTRRRRLKIFISVAIQTQSGILCICLANEMVGLLKAHVFGTFEQNMGRSTTRKATSGPTLERSSEVIVIAFFHALPFVGFNYHATPSYQSDPGLFSLIIFHRLLMARRYPSTSFMHVCSNALSWLQWQPCHVREQKPKTMSPFRAR
jgi:hypothetical protein